MRSRLTVTQLEDRRTPASTQAAAAGPYAAGVDQGQTGDAVVYNADGSVLFQVSPYGAEFTGGVRVALADVTGDGTPDLITAPGPGTEPLVKVYDGAALLADGGGGSLDGLSGAELANFFAGDPDSRDGVRVGVTITTDGTDQVVALDVATHSLSTFATDGEATGSVETTGGGTAGFFACSSSGDESGADGSTSSTSAATHFLVLTDRQSFAGSPTRVTVVALDASNRIARGYTGTVHLSSTDSGATLPDDYTFTADNHGVHAFSVTLATAGDQTVTATDTADDTLTGSVTLKVRTT